MSHESNRFALISGFYDAIQEFLVYKYHTYNSSLSNIEISDEMRSEITYYDSIAEHTVESYRHNSNNGSSQYEEYSVHQCEVPLGKLVI